MDCKNCELKQRQFICADCIKKVVRDFRFQTQHYGADRDEHVSRASKALEDTMNDGRLRRASVARSREQVEELQRGLTKLREDNERRRQRMRELRETQTRRRRLLAIATLPVQPTAGPSARERLTQSLSDLSVTIARARAGLVQELVEVFNVVEVGGRPPVGAKAGTKGEWTIGGLVLPVPGDMRRYPPDHINAVITHSIHFLGLLSFYLGVKLPFELSWTGGALGVGTPMIGAGRGGESGGWARWHTKHPLHLSSSSASSASSVPANVPSGAPADSVLADPPASAANASFTTALAMLLYNVCYLAHTQGTDVPLAHAGDVLSNLWAVCCSPDIGRRSHQTPPLLPPPTPSSFTLDFAQLLQAISANPVRRRAPTSSRPARSGKDRKEDMILEEGWDLVDDVAEGFE